MRQLPAESIDLIYIDPPFGTNSLRKSKAWNNEVQGFSFYDSYGGGIKSYVSFLSDRLEQMHRLLKPTGSIYVHLDWRSVHYIKVKMDEIFGEKNFVNEIIWCYQDQAGRKNARFYKKTHDTILWYSKNKSLYKINSIAKQSLSDSFIKRFRSYFNSNGQITYKTLKEKSPSVFKKLKCSPEKLNKVWVDKNKGTTMVDWWTDIKPLKKRSENSRELFFYPTQKPLSLLERIIETATNKGDIVADFFSGCGTTISTAEGLGRKWLGVDASKEASKVIRKRMARDHSLKIEITPLKNLNKAEVLRLNPFEFESYCVRCVGGIPNEKQRSDGGIDGKLIYDGTPIQVKKSPNVGRPVIDTFHKHLRKNGRGIIIAISFFPWSQRGSTET